MEAIKTHSSRTADLCNFDPYKYFEKFTAEKILADQHATPKEPQIIELLEHLAEHGAGKTLNYNDPIHGQRELPEWMLGIINTPPMLRLSQVGQMTLMPHSRLAHSIGVAILALDLADNYGVDDSQKRQLVSLALLHDVRHGPYSHLFDNLYVGNKKDWFDHDARLHEFLLQDDLHQALKAAGLQPKDIVVALADPKKDDNAYIVKEILDRVDYAMRDAHYAAKGFDIDLKDKINDAAMGLFYAIKYDSTSRSFYFSSDNGTQETINKFLEVRQFAFEHLAYDEDRKLAQAIVYSQIKEMLVNLKHKQSERNLVIALSHLSDPDLERRLAKPAKSALNTAKESAVLSCTQIDGSTLTDLFTTLRGRTNGGRGATTTILDALKGVVQNATILVSIVPKDTPKMYFKLIKNNGDFKLTESYQKGTSANSSQTKCIAIGGYDKNGNIIKPSNELAQKVQAVFISNGWIKMPETLQHFSSYNFMPAEMPAGAEEHHRKLRENPDRLDNP